MGTTKNAVYKVDNGVDFDEIHFRTKAAQVFCNDGKTVESQLAEIMNEGNITTNGWFKDKKTGLIIQWGAFPLKALDGVATVTLPISFPSKTLSATANVYGCDGNPTIKQVEIGKGVFFEGKSQLVIYAKTLTNYNPAIINIGWIALGH